MGKAAEAKQVLQRLAEGEWQPRFRWIQEQARLRVKNAGE
jgi:hypothetical protein